MSLGALSWRAGKGKLRLAAVLLGAGLFWSVLAPVGRADPVEYDLCGPDDSRELGIQGDMTLFDQETRRASDGYNCGLLVVGHNDLGGGGGATARAGHCFFTTGGGSGIQVIDMNNPTDPQIIEGAALQAFGGSEQMHAVVKANGTAVLAYGRGIYDVTECTRAWTEEAPLRIGGPDGLRELGDIKYSHQPGPANSPHNIKLSPDGTKMAGTMPLTITDISNLADPTTWTPKYIQCAVAKQTDPAVTTIADPDAHPVVTSSANFCDVVQPKDVHVLTMPRPQLAHEPEFNADGTRLYIAGQRQSDPFDGDVAVGDVSVFKRDEYLHVLDMTGDMDDPEWPTVLSETFGAGHGMQSIKIKGRPDESYLMHSNEGGSPGAECKPEGSPNMGIADQNARVYLTDIGNELAPEPVSSMWLEINTPETGYCAAQLESNLGMSCRMAGSAASRGCASTAHYHQVDNPANATFGMLSMMSAGLRIWDIRDPANPHEVAYWSAGQTDNTEACASLFPAAGTGAAPSACGVPAMEGTTVVDPIGAYAHYDAATGYIWVNTRQGGLWVLQLEPQVRDELGLPALGSEEDRLVLRKGGPAKPL